MRYFERVLPGQADVDSALLAEAIEKLSQPRYGAHALMVLRHGKVVAEHYRAPYEAGTPHTMFSVSKSFTAIAAGFAQQEGLIRLTDKVADYFTEYLPAQPCENMLHMEIRHLLMMAAGFDAAPDDFRRPYTGQIVNDFPYSYADFRFDRSIDWAKDFMRAYVAEQPGKRFIYSSACTYMISAILQKVTGQRIEEYLKPRLFEPLGMDPAWQQCSAGRNVGGWGMSLGSEDLAKFGQFMLQQGRWEGHQLLDSAYIREMTSAQVEIGNRSAKWEKRFGYQVWLLGDGDEYGGIGAFGQMYIVFPALDAVFVMLGASRMYMKALDVIMGELREALQGDRGSQQALPSMALEPLGLPDGYSSWDMPGAQQYAGIKYAFAPNLYHITAMKFEFGSEDKLILEIDGETSMLPIGYGYWEKGRTSVKETVYTDAHNQLIFETAACAGAWEDGVYHLNLAFPETCYRISMQIRFWQHGIEATMRRNIGFVTDANTTLLGVRIS